MIIYRRFGYFASRHTLLDGGAVILIGEVDCRECAAVNFRYFPSAD